MNVQRETRYVRLTSEDGANARWGLPGEEIDAVEEGEIGNG